MTSRRTQAKTSGAMLVNPAQEHLSASEKRKSMGQKTSTLNLTANALSSLAEPAKGQIQDWLEKPQTHEQLALGQDTLRAVQKITDFFDDVDKGEDGK